MTTMENDAERRMQEAARKLVDREVVYCVSALVSELASAYGDTTGRNIGELVEQASELCAPVQDYESAAQEEGWQQADEGAPFDFYRNGDDFETAEASDWQDLCYLQNIEPHDCEVYEHWIVSRWLADKLEARGEKVDRDFAGLTVWARTTTGQAILLDGVIRDIVRDLGWDKADAA